MHNPRDVRHACCLGKNANHIPYLVNCNSKYMDKIKYLGEKREAFTFGLT